MNLSRREWLAAVTTASAVAGLGGCEKLISTTAERLGQTVPESVEAPAGAATDPAYHLLSRAGYGPWPGDVEKVRAMGENAWIEQQLDPASINDKLCDLRARRFEELEQRSGECYEYDKPVLREEMARHSLLRAVYSKRQLFEVMVSFWTDHLNINIEKGDCIYLKPADDREVIRKHALGNFRDLIRASATSGAMLVYLDGKENKIAKAGDVPNENYARELLELHTLGVHGGYTQRDVYETARCLTGWRVRDKFRRGSVYFDPDHHDGTAKQVLGHSLAKKQGAADLDAVVDIACRHPSTAQHIAEKLVRRFVAEEPPAALVGRVAEVFVARDGDIKSLLRTILQSDEFRTARGTKFKQPFRFVASALRALGADTHAHAPLIEYLVRMGQGVFQYPTPDGYPDRTAPWLGSLLWRWNFAFALAANQVPSVQVPVQKLRHALGPNDAPSSERWFQYFAGREPTDQERNALTESMGEVQAKSGGVESLIGLLVSSPAFQRY